MSRPWPQSEPLFIPWHIELNRREVDYGLANFEAGDGWRLGIDQRTRVEPVAGGVGERLEDIVAGDRTLCDPLVLDISDGNDSRPVAHDDIGTDLHSSLRVEMVASLEVDGEAGGESPGAGRAR